jgi:nicotinamidase-related amidase
MIAPDRAALLLIDLQTGFDADGWGQRNNPSAEDVAAHLLAAWRDHDALVVHVRHDSTEPDSPLRRGEAGFAWKAKTRPAGDECVVTKRVNAAFVGTDLEPSLREHGVETVVLAGLTTDHCVSTTARLAENLGFSVVVVRDATATFDRALDGERFDAETVHRTALAQLAGEFATVASADEVLAGLEDG